ncbi:MAG TPA: DUF4236 domain-containing protein [Chloroflexia bacterium]
MGWRFHKSVKIAPGVRLNLSKRGPGLSFGGRGMRYSVGPSGRRTTVGIPGTGLSYVKQSSTRRGQGCSCCLGLTTLALGVPLAAALTVARARRRAPAPAQPGAARRPAANTAPRPVLYPAAKQTGMPV